MQHTCQVRGCGEAGLTLVLMMSLLQTRLATLTDTGTTDTYHQPTEHRPTSHTQSTRVSTTQTPFLIIIEREKWTTNVKTIAAIINTEDKALLCWTFEKTDLRSKLQSARGLRATMAPIVSIHTRGFRFITKLAGYQQTAGLQEWRNSTRITTEWTEEWIIPSVIPLRTLAGITYYCWGGAHCISCTCPFM